MTHEEFKAAVSELMTLATPETQAKTSDLLTAISDGFDLLRTENETATAKVTELTNNNETLRAVNAKLFLKVGEVPKTEPATVPSVSEQTIEPVDFSTLFNEKGDLI